MRILVQITFLLSISVSQMNANDGELDDDGDGLLNWEEDKYGTNKSKKDSDNDKIDDWSEIHIFNTSPNKSDTDEDTLSDGYEIGFGRFRFYYVPNTWTGASQLAERTGSHLATIINKQEQTAIEYWLRNFRKSKFPAPSFWIGGYYSSESNTWHWENGEPFSYTNWQIWSNGIPNEPNNIGGIEDRITLFTDFWADIQIPFTWNDSPKNDAQPSLFERGYYSDPLKSDTDGDGLFDDVEVKQKTNPNEADTDQDLLTDFEEVVRWKTDPLEKDSDGDGYVDSYEIEIMSSPTNSESVPPSEGTIKSLSILDGGFIRFQVFTKEGGIYRMQVSDDLMTWINHNLEFKHSEHWETFFIKIDKRVNFIKVIRIN